MIANFGEMNRKQATAVAKLMNVYAEHFTGESCTIVQNDISGDMYMSLECISIVPFVNGSGDVFFEVFDYETGDVKEFETLQEAEDVARKLREDSCLIEE